MANICFSVNIVRFVLRQVMLGLWARGKSLIQQLYCEQNISSRLLYPPVDNPKNVFDYPLCVDHYKVMLLLACLLVYAVHARHRKEEK